MSGLLVEGLRNIAKSPAGRLAATGVVLLSEGGMVLVNGCITDSNNTTVVSNLGQGETEVVEVTPDAEVRNILSAANELRTNYFNLRKTRSEAEIYVQAQKQVVDEIAFYQSKTADRNFAKTIAVSQTPSAIINGKEYGLYIPRDLMIAQALMETAILADLAPTAKMPWGNPPKGAFRDIEDLLDKPLWVEDKDTPPFASTAYLAFLKRSIPLFEKVDSSPWRVVTAQNPASKEKSLDIFVMGDYPLYDLIEYYSARAWVLSQNHQGAIEQALRSSRQPIRSMNALLLRGNATSQDLFRHDFNRFVINGRGFREAIIYAELKGLSTEAAVLRARYNTLRDGFGREFDANGEDIKPEYQKWQLLEVDDPEGVTNPSKRGVFLRPEATLALDPSWPYVVDNNELQVVGGPEYILDDESNRVIKMWYVIEGKSFLDGKVFMPKDGQMGWIRDIHVRDHNPSHHQLQLCCG